MEHEHEWMREEEYLRGVLIGPSKLEEDMYVILFPYTKQGIKEIRPGALVGVVNFASSDARPSFSVLEVSQVLPVHYALGETAERTEKAYPGFRVEAAKAAAADWEQTEPVEETTKIRVLAVPTGFKISRDESWLVEEEDIGPMPGGEALLLSSHGMDRVINGALSERSSVSPASLLTADSVPLRLKPQEIIRKHFGVFGFTGTGKSNLVSTLVRHMIDSSHSIRELRGLKVVVIDYMIEYFPLLADLFQKVERAYLLYLDASSLPSTSEDVIGAISGKDVGRAERVAELIIDNMIVPEEFESDEGARDKLITVLSRMIREGRVKVLSEESLSQTVRERLRELWHSWDKHKLNLGNGRWPIMRLTDGLSERSDITAEFLKIIAGHAEGWARDRKIPAEPLSEIETKEGNTSTVQKSEPSNWGKCPQQSLFGGGIAASSSKIGAKRDTEEYISLSQTAQECLREVAEELKRAAKEWERTQRMGSASTSIGDLVRDINMESEAPYLVVALSDRPQQLRHFFAKVATKVYESRKARGQRSPLCLLVVDEADEFISYEGGEYSEARSAAEVIARRGRKLGIGLGVATQRAAYIDTKVVGQLHTYFVSKLPRESDRKKVAEAYGVPRSYVDRALSLRTGEWLVMSHSATRIRGKPLLVRFEDSVRRAIDELNNQQRGST